MFSLFDAKTVSASPTAPPAKHGMAGDPVKLVYDNVIPKTAPHPNAPDSLERKGTKLQLQLAPSGKFGVRARRSNNRPTSVVPALETSISVHHRYRYECTTGEVIGITIGSIFGAIGGIGSVVNTSIASFASSFRVRRVTVYESAQSVSTVNSAIYWASTADVNSPDKYDMNSTIPYDRPSRATSAPPDKSLASFWWNGSSTLTTVLFSLQAAVGSIVDFEVDYTLPNIANNVTIAVATAVVGLASYLPLDGPATNKLSAIGLPTTH
jgi:hypothetical protein